MKGLFLTGLPRLGLVCFNFQSKEKNYNNNYFSVTQAWADRLEVAKRRLNEGLSKVIYFQNKKSQVQIILMSLSYGCESVPFSSLHFWIKFWIDTFFHFFFAYF